MQFIITTLGLNAALNAEIAGVQLIPAFLAVGDVAWQPTAASLTLQNERERVPVAGGEVNGNVLHVNGLLDSGDGYWIRECGVFLADGTLFAVWSGVGEVGWYKNPAGGADGRLIGFDVVLEAIPSGTITVAQASEYSLTLLYAEQYAKIAISSVDTQRRQIAQFKAMTSRCGAASMVVSAGGSGGGGSTITTTGMYYEVVSGSAGVVNMQNVGIANPFLLAQIYTSGTPLEQVDARITVSADGLITWQTDIEIEGVMVIYGSTIPSPVTDPLYLSGPPGSLIAPMSGDLTKLDTWSYLQVADTVSSYFRCFAISDSGLIVAGGDGGMLYSSSNLGLTWTEVTALSISDDIHALAFSNGGELCVATKSADSYVLNSALDTVLNTITSYYAAAGSAVAQPDHSMIILGTQNFSSPNWRWQKTYYKNAPAYDVAAQNYTVTLNAGDLDGATYPTKFRIIEAGSDMYWPATLADGGSSLIHLGLANFNTAGNDIAYTGQSIAGFSVNNINYAQEPDELMWVGDAGKAFISSGPNDIAPVEIVTGETVDLEDCAYIADAWVIMSKQGVISVKDDVVTSYIGQGNYPRGDTLLAVPSKGRLFTNDLQNPGYIRVCQL